MTIPFRDIFKKWTDRFRPVQSSVAPNTSRSFTPAASKAGGDRLSKTVMPNTTRSTSSDFFKAAGDSAPNVRAAGGRALPPTVALALQPRVERAIQLQLSDLIDRVPADFLKPAESFDATQSILLKASEIEKGMADGKPAVSLFSVYEQVPDIFLRTVRPDDATQIPVPEAKVLDQLRKMQIRDDQETEGDVPQVDTPILKVTIEDTERFGTKIPKIQTSDHPRVKVEPATARTLSNAEPEGVLSEKLAPTPTPTPTPGPAGMPFNLTTAPKVTPRPSAPDPVSPTRIPFKLPPKGAGEPASERVPASSGSSVPPSVPVQTSATRIPFKMTPPSDALKPKRLLVPGVAAAETAEKKAPMIAVPSGAKISLGLRPVMQNMPSFQLHRTAESVAPEARIELPLALVESQLSSGRIAIPVKLFQEALPTDYKELLVVDAVESPVLLPLQEVLKNLSPGLLKMRDDQVLDEVAEGFETPFSIKAAEDAKRFSEQAAADETPVAPAAPAVEAAKTAEVKPPEAAKAQEIKPLEVAKTPEAKLAEAPKASEAKQPEPAKAPELKPLEVAKVPEAKQPEQAVQAKQTDVAKAPEAKEPQVAKAPEVKQLELPKLEAKPAILEPIEKVPVLRMATPQPAPVTKPIPEVKPPVESKPETAVEPPAAPKIEPKVEAKIEPALRLKIETPNELKFKTAPVPAKPAAEQKSDVNTNAKAAVEQANALPGVAGSVVIFEDGLNLAGKLSDDVQTGGLCAMAPTMLQRINRHTIGTKYGPLVSMTLSWKDAQLSFFMTGSVCLAALHSEAVLPAETHRQLAAKTAELSRIYKQPGEKHVDH